MKAPDPRLEVVIVSSTGARDLLRACLQFASAALRARSYTLAVAAFNRRAITVYQRAGFQEVDRFEHFTNGGRHAFIRMARSTPEGRP